VSVHTPIACDGPGCGLQGPNLEDFKAALEGTVGRVTEGLLRVGWRCPGGEGHALVELHYAGDVILP